MNFSSSSQVIMLMFKSLDLQMICVDWHFPFQFPEKLRELRQTELRRIFFVEAKDKKDTLHSEMTILRLMEAMIFHPCHNLIKN